MLRYRSCRQPEWSQAAESPEEDEVDEPKAAALLVEIVSDLLVSDVDVSVEVEEVFSADESAVALDDLLVSRLSLR